MIITFCGHADFVGTPELERQLASVLETVVKGQTVDFYLGGYGGFDRFVLSCVKAFRKSHKNVSISLITPYPDPPEAKTDLGTYDSILYPGLENTPKRFAIPKRNEWMVREADLVIAYVDHAFGGAYKTLAYAKRQKKPVLNLAPVS